MVKYRVSIENTFCRDVFVEAQDAAEAEKKALEEDYNDDDWCEGHELRVTDVKECDEDWNEL